ncbi:hypothetical protein [Tellurirhabdus rosea]|uniref:hypothetical protein n=1 Tax=Tellurirhabdus rosea TaxID=2674997 RepID=UPI002250C42E|nr:hypothetical protein [Tellurirhabdus rosea]
MRLLFLALIFVSTLCRAQFLTEPDQNPTSLHWFVIRSPHFRVIYPQGMDSTARQTLIRLETAREPVSQSLGRRPRPLSVILQNQTTVSNGFVTLLPRRSEFFSTPPQSPFLAGTLNWLDQLALHEYRHVVQYEKGLTGISGAFRTVFGDGMLAVIAQGMPDWFFEGDAVGAETVLSRSGRGRIPEFDLGLRANLLAGRRYSYPKAVSGSFRDNVPNHYVLGYFLTTYLKRNQGANAWDQILSRYYRFPFYPFSFSNSLKKTTGYRVEELYRRTMQDLETEWRAQQEGLPVTPGTPLVTGRNRAFTNYQFPQFIDNRRTVAVKSGLADIQQLVILSPEAPERRVHVQGLFNDPDQISAAAGKVVWTEFIPDPRWGARIFSDLKLLDVASGKVRRLTYRGRFTTASLSPDASRLIAVENDENGLTRLVVLETASGRARRSFSGAAGVFYQHPRWADDGRTVVVVRLAAGRKTLEELDTETGTRRLLLPERNENLSHPQPWREWVFYNSPRSGMDNIYALNRRTGQQFQVTSRPLGAYHAAVSPDGTRLAFQDFTADGHRILEMPLEPARWRPLAEVREEAVRYFGPVVRQDAGVVPLDSSAGRTVARAERYRPLVHAFNIFSYGPLVSSSGQELQLGIQSQDLLGTTLLAAAYSYDATEQTGAFSTNLSYRALFPIIDLGFTTGQRRTSVYVDRREPLDSLRSDRWNYNQFRAGLRLPLNLTRSRYLQSLNASVFYNFQSVKGYELPARFFTEAGGNSLHFMNYGLSYNLSLKQSKRDVAPRLGIGLSATLRHTPFGGALRGELWGVSGGLFLPGIGRHHSIRFRGAYQQQRGLTDGDRSRLYRFAPAVLYPRGAPYIAFDRLLIGGAEYHLPLLNTHWALGRWLYVQRVKGMVFTDVAQGQSRIPASGNRIQQVTGDEHTVGADLSFVFNPLRLRTNLEVGVRTIYNVRTGLWDLQPLVIDVGF